MRDRKFLIGRLNIANDGPNTLFLPDYVTTTCNFELNVDFLSKFDTIVCLEQKFALYLKRSSL